jgi:hypothetical protein
MTTVAALGQFGLNNFTAKSDSGVVVDAKWLTDSVGANYIIDPNTGKPYIVPRDYDPAVTAAYFQNKLNIALAADNAINLGVSSVTAAVYPELYKVFSQGGWGDIQRPLADKTDVVRDFIPAASFNLGVAAAAGGVSAAEAIIFGGWYNVKTNGIWNLIKNPLQAGNNPDNPAHISDGAEQFDRGAFGIHDAENTTSPDGLKTATNIDSNGDGRADVVLTTTRAPDNSYVEDAKYLAPDGSTRGETATAVNAAGTKATTTVDTNGDGRWETETIALANGSVEQNTAINDNGTSTKTVFDTVFVRQGLHHQPDRRPQPRPGAGGAGGHDQGGSGRGSAGLLLVRRHRRRQRRADLLLPGRHADGEQRPVRAERNAARAGRGEAAASARHGCIAASRAHPASTFENLQPIFFDLRGAVAVPSRCDSLCPRVGRDRLACAVAASYPRSGSSERSRNARRREISEARSASKFQIYNFSTCGQTDREVVLQPIGVEPSSLSYCARTLFAHPLLAQWRYRGDPIDIASANPCRGGEVRSSTQTDRSARLAAKERSRVKARRRSAEWARQLTPTSRTRRHPARRL